MTDDTGAQVLLFVETELTTAISILDPSVSANTTTDAGSSSSYGAWGS